MSEELQKKNAQTSNLSQISIDGLLRDARKQLRAANTRRRELQETVRKLATLKRRKLPSELF